MYEVELKARISNNVETVLDHLDHLTGKPRIEQVYYDIYFDTKDHVLARSQKELRIRTVITKDDNATTTFLTYKEPPFDMSTDSKPEFETMVTDGAVLEYILRGLGWHEDVRFTKHCFNYEVPLSSYQATVTVVTLDEIQDVYIELEIQVANLKQAADAKSTLYSLLKELNIPIGALTTDGYMDMVRNARGNK